METFLTYILNKAERNRDVSKIKTLGPFALVLDDSISFCYELNS